MNTHLPVSEFVEYISKFFDVEQVRSAVLQSNNNAKTVELRQPNVLYIVFFSFFKGSYISAIWPYCPVEHLFYVLFYLYRLWLPVFSNK